MNVYTVQPHQVFVSAREWFDRVNGNTYSSVAVFVDGRQVAIDPFFYGHGSLTHKDRAVELLTEVGVRVAGVTGVGWAQNVQHRIGYDVADVTRRKDLHDRGRGDTWTVDLAEFVCRYSAGPSDAFRAAGLDFDTHGKTFTAFVCGGMSPADAATAAAVALAPVEGVAA